MVVGVAVGFVGATVGFVGATVGVVGATIGVVGGVSAVKALVLIPVQFKKKSSKKIKFSWG